MNDEDYPNFRTRFVQGHFIEGDPVVSVPKMKTEAERLNILASAAIEAWGWLPLNARYRAARVADEAIQQWRDSWHPQHEL